MKKFLVRKGFVIVLLIIIFIVLIISFSQKKEEFLSYQVKRCNLKQIVSVTGSLKPAKEISYPYRKNTGKIPGKSSFSNPVHQSENYGKWKKVETDIAAGIIIAGIKLV